MSAAESYTDCFHITGKTFTELARGFMLDERPDKAWRFVINSLGGSAEVLALAPKLLDGFKCLVGDEHGMEPADDVESADYVLRVRRLYAGRVLIRGRWFRPYAVVVSVGPDDARFATELTGCGAPARGITPQNVAEQWYRARAHFYGAQTEDLALDCESEPRGYVLFEACGAPPVWHPENVTPDDALKHYLAAGKRLREEGYCAHRTSLGTEERDVVLARYASKKSPEEIERKMREDDLAAEIETARFDAEVVRVRDVVQSRCAGDTIDLADLDGRVIAKVPRVPFLNYALWRTSMRHLAPPWEPVSRIGMKQGGDDPFHSDWFFGAGFTYDDRYPYDGEMHKAATSTLIRVQREYCHFSCGVLVSGPTVSGVVGENIVVLPNLSMDYYEAACRASAIITEAGGALVHMAIVLREQGVPIVLVPDARKRYPKGTSVIVDAEHGDVRIIDAAADWSDVG